MTKTGLALGGGAVLGAAHIGVLQAIDELDIRVSCVTGTSIGAFVASLYAFGKSWREIRAIALDLSRLTLSQFGLLSNKKFGGIVTELLGKKNIEDAQIPLAMVATDIGTGKRVLLKKGDVASAVMASSCIPGVFMPVNYQGMMLVDGMLVENVPVTPLRGMGAEKGIGVDLLGNHVFKKPENIIGVLLNAFYSTITNTTAMQLEEADLALVFDLSGFGLIDTGQIADIMKAGYNAARPVLEAWQSQAGLKVK